MYLYVIRHGDPDYDHDCLTEKGKIQAELTAKRLEKSNIDEIYSSTLGRAYETASYLANKLNLPITQFEWARELSDESDTPYPDGKLKGMGVLPSTHLHNEKYLRMTQEEAFKSAPGICDTKGFPARFNEISNGIDELLKEHGYERTKDGFYKVTNPNEKHIALFCHGAMMRSVIAHLLNIPYQFIASVVHTNPCGITTFRFMPIGSETDEIVPQLIGFGDIGALYEEMGAQNFYVDGKEF